MRALVLSLFVLSLGCGDRMRPPPPPRSDAGPRPDMDAGIPMRRDGGARTPVVDGTLDDAEWTGGESASSSTPTDTEGSTLRRLLARVVDDVLYVAIEGALAADDVLVLYVDHSLGEPEGVEDLASLRDEDGALDAAISSPARAPSAFRADFAWGTTEMPRTSVGLDAEAGWRDVVPGLSFPWTPAETAPTVCSESACETSIPLATLGGTRPRTIAMFARIVHAAGGWANQTLPSDDASAPGEVNDLLTIDDGMLVVDAGSADAGPDADTSASIVIDGIVGPTEWDVAARFDQSAVASGAFADASARTLFAVRDGISLRVAIVGQIGADDALVMYVDADVGSGIGLASPTPLDDFFGALDIALSKTMVLPADLRIDAAWGTLDLGRTAAIGDDRMGWRGLTEPSAFTNLPGATVCGADACETEISLADLGVGPGQEIGLYVRLVSASTALFSNQTLPLDDGFTPEVVSVYVSLPAP